MEDSIMQETKEVREFFNELNSRWLRKLRLLSEDGKITYTCKGGLIEAWRTVCGDLLCSTNSDLTLPDSLSKRFWIVWCEGTNEVKYKHHTYQQAKLEAERLAKRFHGHKFHVMAAIATSHMNDLVTEEY